MTTSNKKCYGEVFNIGAGEGHSVNKVADLLGGDRTYRDPVIEPKKTKADYQKAEKYYRRSLYFHPESHKALLRLGAVLISLKKYGESTIRRRTANASNRACIDDNPPTADLG